MKVTTWFGCFWYEGKILFTEDEFVQHHPIKMIKIEREIEDVAFSHAYYMILDRKGIICYGRIDDIYRNDGDEPPTGIIDCFEYDAISTLSTSRSFLVSTTREIYLIDNRSVTNDSKLYRLLKDAPNSKAELHPISFPWPVRITQASAGHDFLIFKDYGGNLFSMGTGTRGELGVGLIRNVDEPVHIEQLAGIRIRKVVSGGWHSLALTEGGDVYMWGWNRNGQLGKDKMSTEVFPILLDLSEEFRISEEEIVDVRASMEASTIFVKNDSGSILQFIMGKNQDEFSLD